MADNFELYRQAVFLIGEGGVSLKPQALKPKGEDCGTGMKSLLAKVRSLSFGFFPLKSPPIGIDWRADFAVITAFNPDGRAPAIEREGASGKPEDWIKHEQERLNQAAHQRLKADLLRLTKPRWLPDFLHRSLLKLRSAVQPPSSSAPVGLVEVTGCSPDLQHREPGWAANIPLAEALRLGRLYRQDAIFWISAGQLYLVVCSPGANPELMGLWSDRVGSVGFARDG